MPGELAHHLRGNDNLDEAERAALDAGREVRRSQGFILHLTATPQVHQALLAAAAALGAEGVPPPTARPTWSTSTDSTPLSPRRQETAR